MWRQWVLCSHHAQVPVEWARPSLLLRIIGPYTEDELYFKYYGTQPPLESQARKVMDGKASPIAMCLCSTHGAAAVFLMLKVYDIERQGGAPVVERVLLAGFRVLGCSSWLARWRDKVWATRQLGQQRALYQLFSSGACSACVHAAA